MSEKVYYTIGEVAHELGVNPSLLRFWEKEIPALQPHKNNKGTRYYSADDIALLKHIDHLTRDCGYTLDGVNDQLRQKGTSDSLLQVSQTLLEAKEFLLELKAQL
jgi:DNA-binding transcriptional MerR regulator